jgi:hypothetical protein
MSRRPTMRTRSSMTPAQKRELRKEMARISELAEQRLREAIAEGLVRGRIEDGEIVITEAEPEPEA